MPTKKAIKKVEEAQPDEIVLEAGTMRRFRYSNNGAGYPTYPPVIRADENGKEVCRYNSITIKGEARMFLTQGIKTDGSKMVPRVWLETKAEVVAVMPKVQPQEEVLDDDSEDDEFED
jgi:hypothetical protein